MEIGHLYFQKVPGASLYKERGRWLQIGWEKILFITMGENVENLSQIRIKSSNNDFITGFAACLECAAGESLPHHMPRP